MAEYLVGGTTTGSSALSASSIRLTIAFSGHLEGSSVLSDGLVKNEEGTTAGLSTLSEPNGHLIRSSSGIVQGSSTLFDIYATPMHGLSVFTAFCEVLSQPKSLACVCVIGKSFRWNHVYSRGDLSLFITDEVGTPISPFEVVFTMFYRVADRGWVQAGPADRRPVLHTVGEYYVTGTAGELGQPGDWQIRWYYRRSFNAPLLSETYQFRVEDAASKPLPGDTLCRHTKYGWS